MDSDEEVAKFHQNKLLLPNQNLDSDENSSEDDQKLTHETIKYHLEEEKKIREQLQDELESDQEAGPDSDQEGKVNLGTTYSSRKANDYKGSDRLGRLSRAEKERNEQLVLEEAISKKRAIENLIEDGDCDPELAGILQEQADIDENADEDEDARATKGPSSEIETETKDENSLDDQEKLAIVNRKYPEIPRYIKIYNDIVTSDLPATEELLKQNADALTDVLIEFLTTKRTLLLDFITTITFYLSVAFKEFPEEDYSNLQDHPAKLRLDFFEKCYHRYSDPEDDFFVFESIINSIGDGRENDPEVNSEDEPADDSKNNEIPEPESEAEAEESGSETELTEILMKAAAKREEKKQQQKKASLQTTAKSQKLETAEGDDKREITKEMAKNKGHVLSKKKKIDRNPRVKHREKFRKAKVRQKGQIAPMRDRTHQYDGERGYRVGVIKSKGIN